ncbi:MAG TPA: DUF2520 domain-containing protein [Acidimicrobiales bacterium]|nr:DUF2520 domain-containing protein [Acidimicrobiales bacterium]
MRVRIIGPGRAGRSLHLALARAHWPVEDLLGRRDDLAAAAHDVDLLVIAVPDAAVADVAAAVEPDPRSVVAHLSGSLGLGPLSGHPRRAVLHPLVAMPDPERGAERLVGAWFGLAVDGDPLVEAVVDELHGRVVRVAEGDWARYHAAAAIAANHLVALLGQVERVAASIGAPLEAYLDLARGSLADVAALGPAAALTGPVRRGDTATVERHQAALPEEERAAYRALAEEAARLCP